MFAGFLQYLKIEKPGVPDFADWFIAYMNKNERDVTEMKTATFKFIIKHLDNNKLAKIIVFSQRYSSFKEWQKSHCRFEGCLTDIAYTNASLYKLLPTPKQLGDMPNIVEIFLTNHSHIYKSLVAKLGVLGFFDYKK